MSSAPAIDPREVPLYTVAEAAHYLRIPRKTLSDWVNMERGIITPAEGPPARLSFSNFAEAFVLAALRRRHDVPLQRIRTAVAYVRQTMGVDRPLIHKRFSTDGAQIFVEHMGRTVSASQQGQIILEAIARRFTRIDWDELGIAMQLFPLARSTEGDQPRSIVINPRLGFGRPVLAGTGIRVEVITSRYRAGDSHALLAEDYGVKLELIEDAIRIEMREAA
jgi:uncharacterized protein (DUF433 family)